MLAHERLKQYTEALCKTLADSAYLTRPAILIAADAEVYADSLERLLKNPDQFRYATLLLPPSVGYLEANGTVDWNSPTNNLNEYELARYDVADLVTNRQRFRLNPGEPVPDVGLRLRCLVELTLTMKKRARVGCIFQALSRSAPLNHHSFYLIISGR